MPNWQQYKQFMPLGMSEMFEGSYDWKMPPDVEMEVGPTHIRLPAQDLGGSDREVRLADLSGSAAQRPLRAEELSRWHTLPESEGSEQGLEDPGQRFLGVRPGNLRQHARIITARCGRLTASAISRPTTLDVVYRWSDFITDAGFPLQQTYAPGTWYTEWAMQETPEQARYTASLTLFYKDQETNPFPDTYVFVPALRRSLRLSTTARCSPVFGLDWSYDDAKTNGFNASTSIYTGLSSAIARS